MPGLLQSVNVNRCTNTKTDLYSTGIGHEFGGEYIAGGCRVGGFTDVPRGWHTEGTPSAKALISVGSSVRPLIKLVSGRLVEPTTEAPLDSYRSTQDPEDSGPQVPL